MDGGEAEEKNDPMETTSPILAGSHVRTVGAEADLLNMSMRADNLQTGEQPPTTVAETDMITPRTSKKRKADEMTLSPVLNDEMKEYLKEVNKMCVEMTILHKLIEKNVNTKVEIKEKVRHMAKIAKKVLKIEGTLKYNTSQPKVPETTLLELDDQESEEIVTVQKEKQNEVNSMKELTKRTPDEEIPQESTSVSGIKQPIICERCRGAIKREEVEIGYIRGKLENSGIMTPEDKEELAGRNWPEHLFINTKTKKGNPFIGTVEDDTILVMKKKENSRLVETAMSRFPEMTSMLSNNEDDEEGGMQIDHEEGEYKWMENTIKIGGVTQRRRIFLIQEETTTNAFKAIQKIRREHSIEGTLGVVTTEKVDRSALRKLLEMELRNTEKEIRIYVPNTVSNNTMITRPPLKIETFKTLNIKMKTGNEEKYDETLRELKKEISNEVAKQLGVEITGVMKTESGDMRITVEEKKEGALCALQEKVQTVIGQVAESGISSGRIWKGARGKGGYKSLFLRELETSMTREELEEELKRLPGLSVNHWQVVSLRQTQRGNTQTAKLEVEVDSANRMIREETIKIGWNTARVVECIDVPRCFNCQKLGHMAHNCDASRVEKDTCNNCNQKGHFAKDCKNNVLCRDCGEEGHRSGSMGCQIFRKLVNQARLENKTRLNTDLL
ncbi:hypothetical protein M8J75_008190 [Diaphorina citri]|nr:hypothetical protein M8J75_008190 [Diaphorina citri]